MPRGFSPCCKGFDAATKNCEFDIRFEWWSKSKIWVVRVPDGGSSGIRMNFCPYCGKALGPNPSLPPTRPRVGRAAEH